MKAVISHEHSIQDTTSVTVIHPTSGLQIAITPSMTGFIFTPGVPVEVRRWDGLAYEIVASPDSCGAEMDSREQAHATKG